jgi:hypothetical protein
MKFLKAIPKKIYYKVLDPALRKLKCEILDEVRSRDEDILSEVRHRDENILNEVRSRDEQMRGEIYKTRDVTTELQSRLSQQIADEVVRLHKLVEVARLESKESKLSSSAIVDELIKIHQSLERLSKG